tara:strand:+ start:155 stop:373 length:219 start_codon:yes stop_codon:yes gene_type:complete
MEFILKLALLLICEIVWFFATMFAVLTFNDSWVFYLAIVLSAAVFYWIHYKSPLAPWLQELNDYVIKSNEDK